MPKAILSSLLFLAVMLTAQTTNIAVIDFVGNNVPQADTKALTDRLRAELFQTGKFTVLEREKMDVILNEQQFQLTGCTSDACAVEVGQLLAVQQMVSGSISQVGHTFSVTARLIDVEKGNLISVGKCDLKGDIGDLLTCLNEVAAQLAGNKVIATSKPTATSPKSDGPPEMVFIEGGTFQMGSNEGEDDEKPVHTVTVGDFWLGKYEVTVAEFEKFISATGYQTDAEKGDGSYFWTGSKWEKKAGVNWRCDAQGNVRKSSELNHPVIHVSWNDAVAYCEWLSRKNGQNYRLPTEAEWEYAACGGGKNYKYSWGNFGPEGRKGGNIADESAKRIWNCSWLWEGYDDGYAYTAPVGSYEPNELGLYDMTGNVWEWCQDWYDADYYKNSPQIDPKGPSSGAYRVLRGGSWLSRPIHVRCSIRHGSGPDYRGTSGGFRFARTE